MKRSRRNHSPTFKANVGLQAIRGDKTLAKLAQQHQVHATQISAWKQQLLEHAAELFGNAQSLAEDSQERVQELHAKIGELTIALRQCTAYWCGRQPQLLSHGVVLPQTR
jgi:transposase